MITEELNFKGIVIILNVSVLQLICFFEMFIMFYSLDAVAAILLKSYPQSLFPNTLPIQMGMILSRNCLPTEINDTGCFQELSCGISRMCFLHQSFLLSISSCDLSEIHR